MSTVSYDGYGQKQKEVKNLIYLIIKSSENIEK
jgi:hypothetical protein